MAIIVDESNVCDGFDVRVRLDDGAPCTFHFLQRPADLDAAVQALASAKADEAAALAVNDQWEIVEA